MLKKKVIKKKTTTRAKKGNWSLWGKKSPKKEEGYSIIETRKGKKGNRAVHVFGYGKSAPKSKAQKMAASMRKVSKEHYGGGYTYKVAKSK